MPLPPTGDNLIWNSKCSIVAGFEVCFEAWPSDFTNSSLSPSHECPQQFGVRGARRVVRTRLASEGSEVSEAPCLAESQESRQRGRRRQDAVACQAA